MTKTIKGPLLAALCMLMFTVTSIAQIKKPKTADTNAQTVRPDAATKDGLTLNLKSITDTSTVRIVAYMQDDAGVNTLTWLDGYALSISFVPKVFDAANKDFKIASGVSVYDKNWKLLNPDDIFDVKKANWQNKK